MTETLLLDTGSSSQPIAVDLGPSDQLAEDQPPEPPPLLVGGASPLTAEAYLLDPLYQNLPPLRILNCTDTLGYQQEGYYVSLLALARGHLATPDVFDLAVPASVAAANVRGGPRRRPSLPLRVAILHNPDDDTCPSNPEALRRFCEAGRRLGLDVELLRASDEAALSSYGALFVRSTTRVDSPAFRLSCAASALGLVVIDDPSSILQCSNKVYIDALLRRHGVRTPRSMVAHRSNVSEVLATLGLPCVVKSPDGSFSGGVSRVDSKVELHAALDALFEHSALVLAQEYLPTDFDWRVGILDGSPLFGCRFYTVDGHWQVVRWNADGSFDSGPHETLPVEDVPACVLDTALHAARLVGDGFYGLDLKLVGDTCYVVEINDNPSVDDGVEDQVLQDELYRRVMHVLRHRILSR